MKNFFLTIGICFCINSSLSAQSRSEKYDYLIYKADSLNNVKDYKNAAKTYAEAFKIEKQKKSVDDLYNAACSYALANDFENAFLYLQMCVSENYYNYNHIIIDKDLMPLHSDKKWNLLIDRVKLNLTKVEKNYIKPLVVELDSVLISDQKYRLLLQDTLKKYGSQSKQVNDLYEKMGLVDSINLIKVEKILDQYGWLGPDKVSNRGNTALFAVIQHADQDVQEKYLPMMRIAVEKGNAKGYNLALLEDRVALEEGKKQIYGTQIGYSDKDGYFFDPIDDEPNVNKRRAKIGLPSIEVYARQWNINYKLPKQ